MDRPADRDGYLFDNEAEQAALRFDSLATLFNPVTFRHLEALGIGEGWRCWEVGVGGPSIPQWLADRVGASGSVIGTDIDARWVTGDLAPNVSVIEHDVAADEPPAGPFDLVHERLVLIHVPDRERALARMIESLRPGGWVLVEDYDGSWQPLACPEPSTPEQNLANRVRAGLRELLAGRGADLELGRKWPRLLRAAGLVDVGADAYLSVALPATRDMELANVEQVCAGLVAGGHVTDAEVDAHLDAVRAGAFDVATPMLASAWGRTPA